MRKTRGILLIPLISLLIFLTPYISKINSSFANINSIFTTTSYAQSSDFKIKNGVLKKYKGKSSYVYIPSGVKTIGKYAFAWNDNIKGVTIPNSVTKINSYAFYCDTYLKKVNIPKNVTYMGSVPFSRCYSLTKITVNKNNKKYRSFEGSLFNKDKTKILQYALGKSSTSYTVPSSVKTIGESAFSFSCLKHIYLPKKLKTIDRNAFYTCDELESLTIPQGVKSLKLVCGRCRSLKYVQIPKSVTYINTNNFYSNFDKNFPGEQAYIVGYKNSYAERFAERNNLNFYCLD